MDYNDLQLRYEESLEDIEALQAENDALQARVAELQTRVNELEEIANVVTMIAKLLELGKSPELPSFGKAVTAWVKRAVDTTADVDTVCEVCHGHGIRPMYDDTILAERPFICPACDGTGEADVSRGHDNGGDA